MTTTRDAFISRAHTFPDGPPLTNPTRARILLVDDEPLVRRTFADCLSDRYDCVEAESVIDAFAELARCEFAVVITDVLMPGLSGVELLRKIIDTYPQTAVIMASGVDRPARALDAIRVGAFDYLIKPCDLDVLELTVERAMQRRELLLSAKRYKTELEERVSDLARQKIELERLQTQVVHDKKMASLGQLAAGVAHELNNPAGFIYGNMDLLNEYLDELIRLLGFYDELDLPANVRNQISELKDKIDYANTIADLSSVITDCREGAKRIKDIVTNLRVFSRLDEAEFQKTDIHQGIDSTIRLLSSYYGREDITLVRNYGDLPLVDAFPGQLNQVWMNLLINAAQSLGKRDGNVSITTQLNGDAIDVIVSDNGCGIPEEILDRVFDPFFTTKPVGEGTGLGLSICFSIIERHGGSLQVESRQDVGTTFSVRLPVTAKFTSENIPMQTI